MQFFKVVFGKWHNEKLYFQVKEFMYLICFHQSSGWQNFSSWTPKGLAGAVLLVPLGPYFLHQTGKLLVLYTIYTLNLHCMSEQDRYWTNHHVFLFLMTPTESLYVPWLRRNSELRRRDFWDEGGSYNRHNRPPALPWWSGCSCPQPVVVVTIILFLSCAYFFFMYISSMVTLHFDKFIRFI